MPATKTSSLSAWPERLAIGKRDLHLFLFCVAVGFFARAGVLANGLSADDYHFVFGEVPYGLMALQGRLAQLLITWFIHSQGVNLSDVYVFFGILSILAYAAFAVSILRFLGLVHIPAAWLISGILVAYPYLTELYTFRMALSAYSVAILLAIATLELTTLYFSEKRTRGTALLAFAAAITVTFTYQIFVNYFLVLSVLLLLRALACASQTGPESEARTFRRRAYFLFAVTLLSAAFSLLIVSALTKLAGVPMTGRATLIGLNEIPERAGQVLSVIQSEFWHDEAIHNAWPKRLMLISWLTSIVVLLFSLVSKSPNTSRATKSLLHATALLTLLLPLSVGLIIPFGNWWPVPRVLVHVSVVVGGVFALADLTLSERGMGGWLKRSLHGAWGLLLVSYILIGNQILADQQRLNERDRSLVNRIVARLEMIPGFDQARSLHVQGGGWSYQAPIQTTQGDMNISALAPSWAQIEIFSDISGYAFAKPTPEQTATGEGYCAQHGSWPGADSVTIQDDLAIVCLRN